jgi:hypothetical protein
MARGCQRFGQQKSKNWVGMISWWLCDWKCPIDWCAKCPAYSHLFCPFQPSPTPTPTYRGDWGKWAALLNYIIGYMNVVHLPHVAGQVNHFASCEKKLHVFIYIITGSPVGRITILDNPYITCSKPSLKNLVPFLFSLVCSWLHQKVTHLPPVSPTAYSHI